MREVLIKCSRCHDEYPSSDMRYINPNVMCCKNCLEPSVKSIKSSTSEKPVEKSEFRCTKCNYSFKRNSMPQTCPYCNKKDTLVLTKGINADKFLEE